MRESKMREGVLGVIRKTAIHKTQHRVSSYLSKPWFLVSFFMAHRFRNTAKLTDGEELTITSFESKKESFKSKGNRSKFTSIFRLKGTKIGIQQAKESENNCDHSISQFA